MSGLSSLRLYESGVGPTIVATHGLGDDRTVFDSLARDLDQAGYRVVCWDLPGHNTNWGVKVTGNTMGHAALAHVVAQQPGPVILLGHSLGGYLSLAHALHHPHGVTALVLMSTGPGFRSTKRRAAWNSYIDRVAQRMHLAPGAHLLGHQSDSQVMELLPQLSVPVLHIIGDGDERYRQGAQHMDSVLPKSRLLTIAGAHHKPHVTHAAAVCAAIVEFLPPPQSCSNRSASSTDERDRDEIRPVR